MSLAKGRSQAAGKFLLQKGRRRALEAYWRIYHQSDPKRHLWHGVNAVALVLRARKDGVKLPAELDAREIWRRKPVSRGEQRAAADGSLVPGNGYAIEASVSLGETDEAWSWLGRYIQARGTCLRAGKYRAAATGGLGMTVDSPRARCCSRSPGRRR